MKNNFKINTNIKRNMKSALCVITVLLIVQNSNSYILLTANMEDVQSLAKQLLTSPVAEQVGKIWRRATSQFQREINRDMRRQGEESEEDSHPTVVGEDLRRTQRIVRDLIAITKNSGYLEPIKRAFEVFNPAP